MNRFAQLATLIVASVLAIAAAEFMLRLSGWGTDALAANGRLLQYDATIGWTKVARGHVVYRWMAHRISETSNSFGGRGPELSDARVPERRVLFLGDSFCEGYLVGDEEVFSSVLPRLRRGVTAINLGVAGYSTDQEYLLYQRTGARLNPQTVVLLFFDNDVWFNSVTQEYRAGKPVFEMTGSGLRLTGIPVAPPQQRGGATPCADCPASMRLLQLIGQARLRFSDDRHGAGAGAGAQSVPSEMLAYRRSQPPEIGKAWKLTEALLNQLREVTGDHLAVFYVPTVAAVYDQSWLETKRLYAMDGGWDIHLPEEKLAEICSRLAIPLISPTSRFRQRALQGDSLYFMQDGHWNGAGHRLVAEILAEYLGGSRAEILQ